MKRGYTAILIALAVLTLLSLVFNGIVIFEFLQLREAALRVVSDARALVTDAADDTFSYTVDVKEDIPVSTEIPFSETFSVPINNVVPINTTIIVPVNLGFTTYDLEVPIETVFPVDLEVTVPFSEVVSIRTVVPLDLEVPIEIAVSETPLADYLDDANATLLRTEEHLAWPIWRR